MKNRKAVQTMANVKPVSMQIANSQAICGDSHQYVIQMDVTPGEVANPT
jgi:hypothetical protein